jgi:hypothetical protein
LVVCHNCKLDTTFFNVPDLLDEAASASVNHYDRGQVSFLGVKELFRQVVIRKVPATFGVLDGVVHSAELEKCKY